MTETKKPGVFLTLDEFDEFFVETDRSGRPVDYHAALKSLTAREREVVDLLARGWSRSGAAAKLGISPGTLESHWRHIAVKLGGPESQGEAYRRMIAVHLLGTFHDRVKARKK